MPLLGKRPFIRLEPPDQLEPNEELFYCKLTHEVFRDYEGYFERVILCNSLVWTCSLTGRSGLTFQEAVESEVQARRHLASFPNALKRPILYLATLTRRGRLADLCDDVFVFARDRFFIGEEVDAVVDTVKKRCTITKVLPPEKDVSLPNKKSDTLEKPKLVGLDPQKYKYDVIDNHGVKYSNVPAYSVNRVKGSFTREKSKLFVKRHVEPKDGIWKLKEDAVAKYKLNDTSFKDVFAGPPPLFEISPKKKIIPGMPSDSGRVITSKLKDKSSKNLNTSKNEGSNSNTVKEKSNFKVEVEQNIVNPEQFRGTLDKIMEQKLRQKMEKEKEKEKRKEEKKLLAEYKQEWKRPRDDLECDDLRELPVPTIINCSIPIECFGDAVMVSEFLHRFANLVDLKDSFPKGFTFELLERSLVETDIQGPFTHLLQLLLATIFQLNEEEDREEAEDSLDTSDANDADTDDETDRSSSSETSKSAPCTASLLQLVHGATLKNMPLDCFTLTEILRIHLVSSGAQIQWSTNDRRQYFLEKDPALTFKTEEADILKQLSVVSVYGLSIENRLKILKVLISQLLTFELFRDAIEETNEKLRQTKGELRQLHISYKKEREEIASNLKKKSDAKAKDDEKKTVQSILVQESGGKLVVNGINNVQTEEDQSENESQKLTPEEEELLMEKRLKEQLRKKEEYNRKVAELKSQISELQSASALLPLGRNRSYNRFWLFNSLPGLFVEDDDPFIGTCQQYQTPYNPKSNPSMFQNELPLSFMTKYLQRLSDDKSTNSDKENESVDNLSHKYINENVQYVRTSKLMNGNEESVILNSNLIPLLNPEVMVCKLKPTNDVLNVNESDKILVLEENKLPITGMCTACPSTCPVHGNTIQRIKWSFYYKPEDLESLLVTLNPRGFREGSLREALLSEKEKILEMLGKCPVQRLNKDIPAPIQPEIRKSQRFLCNQPSQFACMAPENALEQILRDTILDIEDKIYAGCLGAIKVEDRLSWRSAIEMGVKDIKFDKKEELKDADDMNSVFCKKIKQEESVSSSVSKQVLKHLASCMLEVAQGIDPKFLKPPLGEDNSKKKQKVLPEISKKAKQQDDGQTDGTVTPPPVKVPKSSFDKWKELLMMCTSLSQLFLYLATLERSVQWSRSGLNARCKICRCSGDAENMLLCDGCNRGHHTYCLKPPLADIPTGDWYCTTCKPKEKPVSPKKNRKYYEEDEESEFEIDENLDDQYESEANEDVCDACYKGGTLICCDGCPLSFHLECVNPPLRRVPRGVWNCPKCVALATKQAAAAKHSANNSGLYKTRAQLLLSFSDKKRSRTSSPASDNGKSRREHKVHNAGNIAEDNGRANRNKRRSVDDDIPFDYVTCDKIITLLLHHPDSWPFLRPVNKKDVPDYYKIIKKPMDLGTIRSKLNNMQYFSNKAFIADVYLVLQNCELYNPRSSVEYKAGQKLLKATENALYTYKLSVCEAKDYEDNPQPPTKSRRTM